MLLRRISSLALSEAPNGAPIAGSHSSPARSCGAEARCFEILPARRFHGPSCRPTSAPHTQRCRPTHLARLSDRRDRCSKAERTLRHAHVCRQTIVMPVSIDCSIELLNGMCGHLTRGSKRSEQGRVSRNRVQSLYNLLLLRRGKHSKWFFR